MISPMMAFQLLQILPGVVGKLTGKEKDAKILSTILSLPKLAEMFKDPSTGTPTDPSPIPGTDPGLTIGGGLSGKYNSLIPGLLGIGKGESPFDPNFNVGQLGIQSPYNNTDDSLFNWLGG